MLRKASSIIAVLVLLLMGLIASPAPAADEKLSKQQLDQLLAPIALYPDDLLTNVLMASTYPLDVVQAARWRKEPANAKLSGDALTKALEAKGWDPSIKALVQFPDVLQTMSDKLDWTQSLGDAFLAQQDEVMDEIQLLRSKADASGNLKTNTQQKVTKQSGTGQQPIYIIEPANPQTVYVPVYKPEVVYGPWWYPDYPPYAWAYPGATFLDGFFWGAGVAIATGIWGWNHFDWHHHNVDIDVNKWNSINVNRAHITSNTWKYRPDHRGPVPFGNKELRDKFGQNGRSREASRDFRGFDADSVQQRLKATDHSRIDDRAGSPASKLQEHAGRNELKGNAGGAHKPQQHLRPATRPAAPSNIRHAQTRRPSPRAFDVRPGSDVRRFSDRGRSSRAAMAGRGGGGRFHGGGRGGRRR